MNHLKRLKLLNGLACLTLLISLVALIAPSSTTARSNPARADGEQMAAIDAYIATQMQELRIPGLSLGIVQGDQIVHLKGFGIADPTGRPVTPQTLFILNSISKSFAALAIMQLVEAGKIELDAPIQRFLPWFQVADKADLAVGYRSWFGFPIAYRQWYAHAQLPSGDLIANAEEMTHYLYPLEKMRLEN